MALLSQLTWPDVDAGSFLLAVPLGSTEQHGPHLPLETDTVLACALADRVAATRGDVLVAPALPYGSSGEHAGFPGTISIGQAALELVVVELVRSADDFAGVVLVSAHGGNAEPLARAIATLQGEGRRVLPWAPRPPAVVTGDSGWDGERWDAHAGHAETSMLLALGANRVRLERAAAGVTEPVDRLLPALRSGGVAAVSSSGVLGDPRGASAEVGVALLNALAADLADAVARWVKEP